MIRALLICLLLTGCGGKLTGYNLKSTVGQTEYEDGRRTLYTGCSVDMHFEVGKW